MGMSTKNAISAAGVGAVISAAKEDSEALKFTYTSSSSLTTGFQSNVTMPGGHMLIVDEPKTMPGGQNKGANPLDLMCASFGTCQEITYKMYATAMGIPLESVSAHIVGDINLNGLVGNGGPVGFKKNSRHNHSRERRRRRAIEETEGGVRCPLPAPCHTAPENCLQCRSNSQRSPTLGSEGHCIE